MKIKSNLNLITFIPVMIVMLLSIYIFRLSFNNYQHSKTDLSNLKKIEKIKEFMLDIFKERKYAVQSLTSNSNETIYNYKKAATKTNKAVNNLITIYNKDKKNSIIFKLIKDIKTIVNQRKEIEEHKLSYKTIFANYDILNSDILSYINYLKNKINTKTNANSLNDALILLKSVSDERDFISNIYTNSEDIENLYIIKLFKNSNITQTLSMVDKKVQKLLSKSLDTKEFINIVKKTNTIKQELLTKGYIISATQKEWIDFEDKKLFLLSQSIDRISKNINNELKKSLNYKLLKLVISLFLILLSLFLLYKYFRFKNELLDNSNLKLLLKKVLNLSNLDKTVDLSTTSGVKNSYKIIDDSLDKISIDRQKAENDNASKSIFLANMSHEIRTPINGIVGFTDILKKSNLNKTQKEYVDIISKNTDNLLEIINNILDLSKIESKKIEVDSIMFSPIEEFENSVELFLAKASKKKINLSLNLLPNFENYLLGDPLKIKEVLLNLISNSLKFTPKGGQIDVSIKKLPSKSSKEELVYFEVKDNGIGMSKDELSDIFDAFSQADSTITRKYGGTGLGLTISSSYVTLMGGELEVESKKDRGTKFFFTLSFKKSQPLKTTKYKNSFNIIKALIISDNETKELSNYLKEYISYLISSTSLVNKEDISSNKSMFEESNLIVVPQKVFEENDFSHLNKTDKKLLIIQDSQFYQEQNTLPSNTFTITEPIGFFKVVEVLSSFNPTTAKNTHENKTIKESNKKFKILIAEDNDVNLKLLEEFFNQYSNITIKKAINGEEAVKLFLKESFDMILMDIAMPLLDGMEATKKIIEYENINNTPHTPIIALTANALKGDKEKYLSTGMDEYITKPVKEDSLITMLKKFSITLNQKELISNKENKKENLEQKQLLLYKKSEVETKIFQKVLSQYYSKIDTVNSSKEFYTNLERFNYQAILLDKEISDLDFESLNNIKKEAPNTSLILFRNFETIISNKLRTIFDETIINSSDVAYLKTILKSYVKED